MVTYKNIPGHSGYRAGDDGSIWSCWRFQGAGYAGPCTQVVSDTWKILKGDPRKEDGRMRYTLRKDDGTYRRVYGYIFVLETFVGLCPEGMECCHRDGDCTNNSIGNLRWDTPVANKKDMIGHGTRQRGEQINTAKLKEDDVRSIRKAGGPLKSLAEQYGVTTVLIRMILKRKVWKHVE